MEYKHFATVMKKTKISDYDFIYSVEKIMIGSLDEESKTFIDENGIKYKSIRDFSDFDNSTNYYSNIAEISELQKYYKDSCSSEEAVKRYENRCREIMYYVVKTDSNDYLLTGFDRSNYLNIIKSADVKLKTPEPQTDTKKVSATEEKETVAAAKNDLNDDEMIALYKTLISGVENDWFSPDELIDLHHQLKKYKATVADALGTVERKMTSYEIELEKIRDKEQTKPIDIEDTFEKVTKTLIAQDEPARRMIVELSRLNDMRKKDYGILLTGESGVGKTLLMSLLAKHLNRPLLLIDSTQLTAPGYVGKDIEEYLYELYKDCDKELSKAERAIVYFDEIDKKGSERKNDVAGQAVLNTLLKFLDGVTYTARKYSRNRYEEREINISTKNMIVVAGGAFLDVYNFVNKKHVGFTSQLEEEKEDTAPSINDFVEKAMMPKEFMGRVPVIIRLNNLDVDAIRSILLDSDESSLKLQEEVFAERGAKLTTKDGYILAVAQQALSKEIGARGLKKIIADTTWKAYDEICSNPGQYEEVILTEETVKDPKTYSLIRKTTETK